MVLASDPANKIIAQEAFQGVHEVSTTKKGDLGAVLAFSDGRVYRYCSTDSDISVGQIVVTTNNKQAISATYFGRTTSAAPIAGEGGAVGDTKIAFTSDVSGITQDEYAGGYLIITAGTGKGVCVRVKGNDASPSSGHAYIYLFENDPLPVALDNTSAGMLIASPFADVAVHTAKDFGGDQDQVVVGRAAATTTAGTDSTTQYFWVQVAGVGALISGNAVQKQGCNVTPAEGTDPAEHGFVQKPVEADGDANYQVCGVALEDTVDTEAFPAVIRGLLL